MKLNDKFNCTFGEKYSHMTSIKSFVFPFGLYPL